MTFLKVLGAPRKRGFFTPNTANTVLPQLQGENLRRRALRRRALSRGANGHLNVNEISLENYNFNYPIRRHFGYLQRTRDDI